MTRIGSRERRKKRREEAWREKDYRGVVEGVKGQVKERGRGSVVGGRGRKW